MDKSTELMIEVRFYSSIFSTKNYQILIDKNMYEFIRMYIFISFVLGIEGQNSLMWAFDKFQVDRKEKPCLISWIHSHVGGSECFFSSIDNHTQYSYQKVHKGVLGLVVEIKPNGKKGSYDFFELSSFGKKELEKCSRQKNCVTTQQHESCMGREFYQSAMTKVLFDDFYSIEVANFMLKDGIESHLPDTEAPLIDLDGEISLQPNHPVTNQRKRKGTIHIFFYNKVHYNKFFSAFMHSI